MKESIQRMIGWARDHGWKPDRYGHLQKVEHGNGAEGPVDSVLILETIGDERLSKFRCSKQN